MEDDAGIGRRRTETNADASSGNEAHALDRCAGRQRPLGPIADDAHGIRLFRRPAGGCIRPWCRSLLPVADIEGIADIIVPRSPPGSLTACRALGRTAGRRDRVGVQLADVHRLARGIDRREPGVERLDDHARQVDVLGDEERLRAGGFSLSSFTIGSLISFSVTASG